MSKVISLRVRDDQMQTLKRTARHMGRSPSEAAAILLGEKLREREFAFIQFRDSPVGRQAYLAGTRLAVWQIVSVLRDYGNDLAKAAEHLAIPQMQVMAAVRYAEAFPEEIEAAIADNECYADDLARLVPNLEVVNVNAAPA